MSAPDKRPTTRQGPVSYRSLFIRAVYDDPTEELHNDEHDLRKKLTEYLNKYPGIAGATVEMRS